jgi:hypothetical protein
MEAWEFLLRKTLKLPAREPDWLDSPAMMRMVVTTPNVFKQRRPDWLGPLNFFLFPLISDNFRGYPRGFDKSNFILIAPYELNRRKWGLLKGVNLVDGHPYEISTRPSPDQDKVLPESFRTLLRKYLSRPEVKSLAPETDRRWDQGEDPSMLDSDILIIYEKRTRLVVADPLERKRWSAIGVRRLIRESKLSQAPVRCIKGQTSPFSHSGDHQTSSSQDIDRVMVRYLSGNSSY